MRTESHQPSADALREQRKAARMLERMEIREEIAVASETLSDGLMRLAFARRYRELIGVDPAKRHLLRSLLQDLSAIDTVEGIIDEVGRMV